MGRRDIRGIAIIILIVLLVLAFAYIGYGFFSSWKQSVQLGTFQQGAQYGYEQAIIQIAQQAITCQQVPLNIENQTINIIAVECLQQAQ
jgi:flagellar basal body-associated protein FliL